MLTLDITKNETIDLATARKIITRMVNSFASYREAKPRTKAEAVARGYFEGVIEVAAIALQAQTPADLHFKLIDSFKTFGDRPAATSDMNDRRDWINNVVNDMLAKVTK